MEKVYRSIQKSVKDIAQKSYRNNLVAGTSGNVSFYDRDHEVMAITASNLDYEIMETEDIVLMKLDGEILYNRDIHKPSSEWQMHAEIYKGLENVNSVIHTHSPRATSFAVVHQDIPLILVEMLPFLGGDIPRAKFALPGTDALGKSAVAALQERNACLLENHGVVAVGSTVEQAYIRAVYVEDAATIYHYARQVGHPVIVSEKDQEKMKEKYKR
ncbi:class II aldolase/adducin family protein [Erysipelothrix urinaevulpis]|uniref:class II aldolase/adducin family protein n=1 Tax=Erysipelothrix urinaevulpis TaxID=2683717 RepID=UPI00135C1CD8|nr:class II aldolase/adducin family protein [Erysipelothrix urinaevulpis]